MKVLGMFFIIWGHLSPEYMKYFIYTFSVPSFFAISGFLFYPCKWNDFLSKNLRSLVVPYSLLGITVILFFAIVKFYFGGLTINYFPTSIIALIIGDQDGFGGGIGCQALWFVYTLFLIKLIANILGGRFLLHVVCSCILLTIAYLLSLQGNSFYSSYADLTVSYPFFALGYIIRNRVVINLPKNKWFVIVICIFLILLISHYNGMVEMYNAHYGNNVFLFVIGGVIGTYLLALISKQLDQYDYHNIIMTLSKGSILVLAWQIVFLVLVNLTVFKLVPSLANNDIVTFFLSIIIYGLFVPIIKLINIYTPILTGCRK